MNSNIKYNYNKNNMKCLCGWYDIYDVEDVNMFVFDPTTSSYHEKNGEFMGLPDIENNMEINKKEDDMIVHMDELYMEDTDTEDTESTRVIVDMNDMFYISSDEEEEEDSPV